MTKKQVERILAEIQPMQFEITVYKPFPARGIGDTTGSQVRGMAATNINVVSMESLRTALSMMEG